MRIWMLSAAFLLGAVPALADNDTQNGATTFSPEADRRALATIVSSSVSDAQLCALAEERSTTRIVRDFCRDAIPMRGLIERRGMELAKKLGDDDVRLVPSANTQTQIESLEKTTGHAFDRLFLLDEIEDRENEQDVLRFGRDQVQEIAIRRFEESVTAPITNELERAEDVLGVITADNP